MSCDHKDQVKTSRYVKGILETTCRECAPKKTERTTIIYKASGFTKKL